MEQKLNFLLVMPRLVQDYGEGYVFTLGIAYVSSSMKKAGFNVFTVNLNHRRGDVSEIIKNMIEEHNVHVVATGGLSPQYHLVKSIIRSAKAINSNIITIVGGGIISSDPEIAMEAMEFADFGVIGEGEATMCDLAHNLENSGDLSKVDGLIFKDDSRFIRTGTRKDIKDIDTLPWPDYEGFDIEKYLDGQSAAFGGLNKKRMICMLGSRSCPFRCTFCFHTNGQKYRRRSLDDFFAELDYLVSRYNIEYISMADELFAPDFDYAKAFCARIKKYNIPWAADFRIDKIKPELLPILKGSGLDVMFFGLESADNRILKSMRKGITIEQIEPALRNVNESGIALYGCFIFGDIAETCETAQNTLKWWREHSQYHIHLTLIKAFPGSLIYQHACKNGIIADPIEFLKDGCPQINISKMSDAEFAEIILEIFESTRSFNALDSIELLNLRPQIGRETISAVCTKCFQKNIWEDIKLFALDNIFCRNCGQKYEIPCPVPLRENLEKNVSVLLDEYGKIAIWGMTITIMDLIKQSMILNNSNVFPIDISESKREIGLDGKNIYAPSIIEEEKIPVVVVAVPSHIAQISCQTRENHPSVVEIIDICRLVDYDAVVTP